MSESTDREPKTQASRHGDDGRTARDDLVDGLGMVFRAARRAAENLDPAKLDELSQKAKERLSTLDRETIGRAGRQAARNLDPAKIERFAGEAGRELVNVVERLATRVERFVDDVQARAKDDGSADNPDRTRMRVREEPEDGHD